MDVSRSSNDTRIACTCYKANFHRIGVSAACKVHKPVSLAAVSVPTGLSSLKVVWRPSSCRKGRSASSYHEAVSDRPRPSGLIGRPRPVKPVGLVLTHIRQHQSRSTAIQVHSSVGNEAIGDRRAAQRSFGFVSGTWPFADWWGMMARPGHCCHFASPTSPCPQPISPWETQVLVFLIYCLDSITTLQV